MPTVKHLFVHVKKYGAKHQTLYILSLMVLFWAVFDGIITYIMPLIITEHGFSKTLMGIIIGSSSVAGAVFDFFICKFIKNVKHRRILMLMFSICFVVPLILFQAKAFFVYLIVMALWGLYFDLHNISNFEFVGHHIEKEDHSSSFAVIHVFQSVGYFLAPIFAGFVIGETVGFEPFVMAWVFLAISLFFFFLLYHLLKKQGRTDPEVDHCEPANLFVELRIWHRVGKIILPALLLTILINLVDAFFWTIGPLLAQGFNKYHGISGFFLAAYSLPPLLAGWFVGNMTSRYGKKKTAFISFLIGSFILIAISFVQNPVALIAVVFAASFFLSLSWPAINGAYADYISESGTFEREIEGLENFFMNMGYFIGPVVAGVLADRFGNSHAFSIVGIFGVLAVLLLMKNTPKRIQVREQTVTKGLEEVVETGGSD